MIQQIDKSLENWLVAERRRMSRPDVLTHFLADKQTMLDAVRLPVKDSKNKGVQKSESHAGQCVQLVERARGANDPEEEHLALGATASKFLKIASGLMMRAGYFHPDDNGLYWDRMINLVDENDDRMYVLGSTVSRVASGFDGIDDLYALADAAQEGSKAVAAANNKIYEYVMHAGIDHPDFNGSAGAETTVRLIGLPVRRHYAGLCLASIGLQGEGLDGKGALILEPRADGDAHKFLRAGAIQLREVGGVSEAYSANSVPRAA